MLEGRGDRSEDVLEVFDAVGLEEDEQDERPQAEDEPVRRVPLLLLGFLCKAERTFKTNKGHFPHSYGTATSSIYTNTHTLYF